MDYGDYLKLDQLLDLQRPLSDEHDESLFIVTHQVYELWFKQILNEIDYLIDCLGRGDTGHSLATLRRVLTILKVLVIQIDVLETMSPIDFESFRDRHETSSGLESRQFREVEHVLGLRRVGTLDRFAPGSAARRILDARLEGATLWDALAGYLASLGYAVPQSLLDRDRSERLLPSSDMQDLLLGLYRRDTTLTQLCERFVDLDEGLQEWRYRHVKMVQRTIGTRPGTGRSPGVAYLLETLFEPVFPDLWAIRERL